MDSSESLNMNAQSLSSSSATPSTDLCQIISSDIQVKIEADIPPPSVDYISHPTQNINLLPQMRNASIDFNVQVSEIPSLAAAVKSDPDSNTENPSNIAAIFSPLDITEKSEDTSQPVSVTGNNRKSIASSSIESNADVTNFIADDLVKTEPQYVEVASNQNEEEEERSEEEYVAEEDDSEEGSDDDYEEEDDDDDDSSDSDSEDSEEDADEEEICGGGGGGGESSVTSRTLRNKSKSVSAEDCGDGEEEDGMMEVVGAEMMESGDEEIRVAGGEMERSIAGNSGTSVVSEQYLGGFTVFGKTFSPWSEGSDVRGKDGKECGVVKRKGTHILFLNTISIFILNYIYTLFAGDVPDECPLCHQPIDDDTGEKKKKKRDAVSMRRSIRKHVQQHFVLRLCGCQKFCASDDSLRKHQKDRCSLTVRAETDATVQCQYRKPILIVDRVNYNTASEHVRSNTGCIPAVGYGFPEQQDFPHDVLDIITQRTPNSASSRRKRNTKSSTTSIRKRVTTRTASLPSAGDEEVIVPSGTRTTLPRKRKSSSRGKRPTKEHKTSGQTVTSFAFPYTPTLPPSSSDSPYQYQYSHPSASPYHSPPASPYCTTLDTNTNPNLAWITPVFQNRPVAPPSSSPINPIVVLIPLSTTDTSTVTSAVASTVPSLHYSPERVCEIDSLSVDVFLPLSSSLAIFSPIHRVLDSSSIFAHPTIYQASFISSDISTTSCHTTLPSTDPHTPLLPGSVHTDVSTTLTLRRPYSTGSTCSFRSVGDAGDEGSLAVDERRVSSEAEELTAQCHLEDAAVDRARLQVQLLEARLELVSALERRRLTRAKLDRFRRNLTE